MEYDFVIRLICIKVIKKGEELAFSNKAKSVGISIPLKAKTFIENNLSNEINHIKKKYNLQINIISDTNLVIPEYKIDLFNKNKKIIKKVENIEKIEDILLKNNFKRKNFLNKKFNKNFKNRNKFRKKFKYHSRPRKNNFDNKKIDTYQS